jgi:Skp family chaperone for outer membrane proteins
MADKKVERSGRERPLTPTQKMNAALSDPGTVNMAEATHDKGKSALVDKFREREERWRRDQSLHDQAAARETHPERQESQEAIESAESDGRAEGGES